MAKVKLYGLSHCSTCKKAIAYLEELDVEIESFRDVKENRLTKKELEKLVELTGGAESLFSKRAMKYRSLGLHEKELSDNELVKYMFDEYTFIRRPVLVYKDKAIAGFSKKKYDELFK